MMESIQFADRSPAANRCVGGRWIRALVGVAVLVLFVPPAWATRVTDVRVGKHPTYTRVVFELDRPSGYQLERNEPAPGIAELVVSLRAASIPSKVVPPEGSLIEAIEIRSDGKSMTAHIRLVRGGLRLKEMMLSEPARIVLDVVDGTAEKKAKAALKPSPVAVPTPAPVIEPVPEPEPVAPVEVLGEDAVAEKPSEMENRQGASPASSSPGGSDSSAAAAMEFASNEARDASSAVEPAVPADTKAVQVAMATPEGRTPPAQQPRETSNADAAGKAGLFNLRNGAFALAGAGLLAAGGYVIARRRRYADDFEDDEGEAFSEDNPFARLESPVHAEGADAPPVVSSLDDNPGEEGIVAGELVEDESGQTDLFAGTPPATGQEYGEPTIIVGGDAGANESSQETTASAETEGSDMSMDGTSDLGVDPDAVSSMPPVQSADNDALMRLVREMEARIGDVETRLEETVDAKERLERQVAAQTEELRVQRAAIARTQRAVRNMSQPVEEAPTEPALREPSPDDQ
ncbi:MAG: hypothetical protein VX246_01775 [Myxococcota bacterium]|nr:hypothetical protein [Myxococcota bacterium]